MSTRRSNGFIRMALMACAFVALTVVLIVFQPGSPRHATYDAEPVSGVTRVAPALNEIPATQPAPEPMSLPQTAALAPDPAPQPERRVEPVTTMPNTMRDMTFAAITNLRSATTGETPAPGEPGSLLHGVVQRSLNASGKAAPSAPNPPLVASTEPVQQPNARSYFVRPGDTLVSIAQELYGDVNMASQLFLANRTLMTRPDDLRAGMVLDLP